MTITGDIYLCNTSNILFHSIPAVGQEVEVSKEIFIHDLHLWPTKEIYFSHSGGVFCS